MKITSLKAKNTKIQSKVNVVLKLGENSESLLLELLNLSKFSTTFSFSWLFSVINGKIVNKGIKRRKLQRIKVSQELIEYISLIRRKNRKKGKNFPNASPTNIKKRFFFLISLVGEVSITKDFVETSNMVLEI